MAKRQKRILLAFGWYDHRLHTGIARYALERGWHLCPDATKERVIPWGWEGDGILAWLGAGDDLAEFVKNAKKPTVDFSYRRPNLPFARVLMDHAGAARMAAEHFLVRGFEHFMFYSDADNWSFDERGRAFLAAVRGAGRECRWLSWQKSKDFRRGRMQWTQKRRWLAAELKKAPSPLALLAATDDHAVEVLEICEAMGRAVPEEISIVGVDNALVAVEAMRTPISSVDMNMEAVGYRGAALLDDLMRGKAAPKEPIRVPVAGLHLRKSSDMVAVKHEGVARSLRFMLEHFGEGIGVGELAKVAAMSRRAFHEAFVKNVGHPPGVELRRLRINRALKLIGESAHKMEGIAGMCGYPSLNGFWYAFRRVTGMSPRAYRDAGKG